ncbi:MAG: hypothetical protein V7K48_16670 [Nostoc sp.]
MTTKLMIWDIFIVSANLIITEAIAFDSSSFTHRTRTSEFKG